MLTVENLSLYKNQNKIFDNLGFSLFLGVAMVVTGDNGSGKTSLLSVLAGISKESSGKLLWGEEDLANMRDDFSGDMQFMGHKNFMKEDLTVLQNLEFYTSFYGSQMLIPSALSFFMMEASKDELVKNLSAGMKKKVMLAKMMSCPSTVWIMDEPDSNLDKDAKKLLVGLIKAKIENKGMVIFSSHEPELYDFAALLNMNDFS